MGIMRHERFKKFSIASIGFTMLLSLGFTGETYAAPKTNKIDVVAEQKLNKDLSKHKINQSLKKTWKQGTKRSSESELIHNNGKPIENDVVDKGAKDNLVAVYRTELNDKEYEKFYFSENPSEDMTKIKQEVLNDELLIESKPDQYIHSMIEKETTTKLPTGFSTMAVKPVPKGGIYKTYKYNFYGLGGKGMKVGTFTSNVEFKRKSSSATVNGKKASVWDIHAYQEFDGMRLSRQETYFSGNYSDQVLLRYGPKSDAGGSVDVTLGGGGPPSITWTFSTGTSHRTSAYGSSLDKKIGKWNWYWKRGVIPLETEPGARFTNSGGPLNVNINHYFSIDAETHNPGNTKVSIPDR